MHRNGLVLTLSI